MNRETQIKVWANRHADESLDEKLARLTAAAPDPIPAGLPLSLPDPSPVVDLAYITATELHDLIHGAALVYLRGLSGLRNQQAHLHAERIATTALQMTAGQDYMTRGVDPRG